MKSAMLKTLLIASLRTADPVGTSRRVVTALAAREAEVRSAEKALPQPFRTALATDMQPLGEALWSAMQTSDAVAMRAGLKKLSARMGDFTRGGALAAVLALESAKAFTTNLTAYDV